MTLKYAEALTVGGLIEHLEFLDPTTPLPLSTETGSYRGYYDHVYIAPGSSLAGQLLDTLRNNLGTEMFGYKGGESTFDADCYVFAAHYGDTGPLLALLDGELVTIEHPFIW